MALDLIDLGDTGTPDGGKEGGVKINAMFTELYNFLTSWLKLDGSTSMDANKAITFTSDGLSIGPSVTDGNGFPAIESSYTEIELGSSGDETIYFNYNKGTKLNFGDSTNRQNINWYLNEALALGVNFDFGSGVQMRYSINLIGAKKYMRFGTTGLAGIQFRDDSEIALGNSADAIIKYDDASTDLQIDTQNSGSGTLDLVSQSVTALAGETVTDYVEIKIAGVLTKLAVVT